MIEMETRQPDAEKSTGATATALRATDAAPRTEALPPIPTPPTTKSRDSHLAPPAKKKGRRVMTSKKPRELLTASRMNAFLACPRKCFYAYEMGLRRSTPSDALRTGTAIHAALEARAKGATADEAYKAALATGEFSEMDAAVLFSLIGGYYNHYAGEADAVQTLYPEVEFCFPLRFSRTFAVAGKIDGLAVLKDGRTALVEHKTCSEDISAGAPYWERLRFNVQLMQYVDAAQCAGWDIECVVYDVIRKPTIRLRKDESPDQFSTRLLQDCTARPEYYFARAEVGIRQNDLDEFRIMRDYIGRQIWANKRASRDSLYKEDPWIRHCNAMTCRSCEYASFCLQCVHVDKWSVPEGFAIVPPNPELSAGAAGGSIVENNKK